MASSYPGPVSVVQVGSYFVGQYYQVLKQHPDLVHQFYAESSTMIHIDGDSSHTASNLMEIHTLASSLDFAAIEIKTINSLESFKGGILVMVTGSVRTKDSSNGRKFVQNFFLAPQEKGYFVLNDIFHFLEDESPPSIPSDGAYQHHSLPSPTDTNHATSFDSATNPDPPQVPECVNSLHVNDETVDKFSLPDHHEEPRSFQNDAVLEYPLEDPPKRTYASIVSTFRASAPKQSPPSDWNPAPEVAVQPSVGLETVTEPSEENSGFDDESSSEPRSVYVRNLPSDVTAEEIEDAFKNFGAIKADGVFLRNRKDVVGVCYAFVEFEKLSAVHNAIKASPIQLCGRQVYIEERRPNSGIASRAAGRGRGRGTVGNARDAAKGRFGSRTRGRNEI